MSIESPSDPSFRSKIDLQGRLTGSEPVWLDLGCGEERRPGFIGIDMKDLESADVIADLNLGLPFLADNSVDVIHSASLLEHIEDLECLMEDVHRVMKPGGRFEVYVPHFSNPFFYSDYTHRRFFGLYTFFYFVRKENQLRRKVPDYYTDFHFRVESISLDFWALDRPMHYLKRVFGVLVNSSHRFQEFYEEHLCHFVPCYGVRVTVIPEK